ncbi:MULTISPECIES: hypothetical protein [Vibrio]|uniref:hypothetical protein n=1 Tax=Vibrio TaxID=662 RepID=UPI00078B6359|nr:MULTISPECIES: hypothetical protein [Vibrio]BAU70938.1 hypothetical protein [Vibrio sp. 04Ya108]BBM67804.1 hypothetical protein VA249_44500 [Vibrio alfacsensis]BCN26975.1 hypothetical protein VYA_41670 [Vibrio alfacsensis]
MPKPDQNLSNLFDSEYESVKTMLIKERTQRQSVIPVKLGSIRDFRLKARVCHLPLKIDPSTLPPA